MGTVKLRSTPSQNQETQRLQEAIQQGFTQLQAYEPSDSDNWEDPQPTTIQAALDRLAACVADLNGGAIP